MYTLITDSTNLFIPFQRQKLCDETQHFTTGKGFHQFIMAHTPAPAEPRDFFFEEYNLDETPTNSELVSSTYVFMFTI